MQTTYSEDNIRLGVCEVSYAGSHVGHTLGGCNVRITTISVEKKTDKYGDVPVGYNDLGTRIEVTVNIAEETISNIASYFPTGATGIHGLSTDIVSFGRTVGTALTGGRLVLDPVDGGEPIVIYKAVPNPDETQEIGYTNDGQRVWSVVFKGLPQSFRDEGDQLFRIGGAAS